MKAKIKKGIFRNGSDLKRTADVSPLEKHLLPADDRSHADSPPSADVRKGFKRIDPGREYRPGSKSAGQQKVEEALAAREREDKIRSDAYAQGVTDGEKSAESTYKSRITPLIQSLEDAASQLSGIEKKYLENVENETVRLAVALAKKIIYHEISINPDHIKRIVQAAIDAAPKSGRIHLYLHPDDFKIISGSHLKETDKVQWIPDPDIRRGGCILETASGDIDARIQSRIGVMEKALSNLFSETRGHLDENP